VLTRMSLLMVVIVADKAECESLQKCENKTKSPLYSLNAKGMLCRICTEGVDVMLSHPTSILIQSA